MAKAIILSVKVSCGKHDSSSSSFLLNIFLKSINNIQMSLRDQMLAYFQQPQIHSKILNHIQVKGIDIDQLDQSALLKMMEELHLLDDITNQVQGESINQPIGKSHIFTMGINKGRKFKQLSQLNQPSSFHFILSGFSQKSKSSSYPTAQNFILSQKLQLNMKTSALKSDNSQNIELIIVATLSNGQKLLYSIKLVEWRFVLVYGSISIDLQLAPYHHDGLKAMPCVGILSITMSVSPLPKHFILSQASLNRQLDLQQKLKQSANNKFHSYANNYWNQIKNVHRSLQSRRVPIYAQTQDKIYAALPKMIKPIFGVRGIDSPHHALRFCSLIPFCEPQLHKQKFFRRFSSMLAGQQGSVQDHCHLLCSLLLGMGLKSYVCVGSTGKGEHSWVMTETTNSLTFWQCSRGIKLDYFSPKALTFYKTLHSVYNHKQYYANLQLDDTISGVKFNFKDGTLWKKMDEDLLGELPPFNRQLALTYPTINAYSVQQTIQTSLVSLISEYRTKFKLSFAYDQTLSSLLATALSNYQIERVTGSTFCEQEFQIAIKSYVPPKHTFKAFPMQFTTLEASEIMSQLQDQPKAKQILGIKGESVFFAVRCKLVIFPDNIFALWLSLAVRYYRLD